MQNIFKKFRFWIWGNLLKTGGYYRFSAFRTPFGVIYFLRWGYWNGGFSNRFWLSKSSYFRTRNRFKI